MFYNEVIQKGISFIKSTQNLDGGIPIGKIGDESGFWTTAESLEAMLSTDYFQLNADNIRFIILMIDYLINGFVVESSDKGYWEGRVGSGASTMTTGHVVFALTLCLNKFINEELEIKVANSKIINLEILKKDIQDVINKATSWMLSIRNIDGGWGHNKHSSSNIVCCYYVLKGLSAVGKNSETDTNVYEVCLLIKKNIHNVMKKKRRELNGDDFSCLLYGYMSLKLASYFKKYDMDFESGINKFIKKNWKGLQQSVATKELASASKSFLNNLSWITLNTLLHAESYTYSKKIDRLLRMYVEQQAQDGSWNVEKNQEKQTTWITAEIVNDFNLAQTRYIKYQNETIFVKKYKMVLFANALLGVLCLLFVSSYTWSCIVGNTLWYENVWSFTITLLGVISSIVTIISIKDEK